MNDRLRYRVWAKYDEKTDTEGHYIDDADYMVLKPDGTVDIEYYVDNGYDGYIDSFEQDEIEVEFSTGLKDKKGNFVYERDIIKSPNNSNNLLVIQAENGLWECVDKNGNRELPLLDLVNYYGVEIIGNINENPELLEKE